jgi:hypothetical protein
MGGGEKTTRILVAYQPCQPHCKTGSNTVWDQHLQYFEAGGNTKSLILNFHDDLVSLLTKWKNTGDEIVIMGHFNEDKPIGATPQRRFFGGEGGAWYEKGVTLRRLWISKKKEILCKLTVL